VKHMSSWRRLFRWNRCAHNRLPLLKHLSLVATILLGDIFSLCIYTRLGWNSHASGASPITSSHGYVQRRHIINVSSSPYAPI
jgi:hypothetical protein